MRGREHDRREPGTAPNRDSKRNQNEEDEDRLLCLVKAHDAQLGAADDGDQRQSAGVDRNEKVQNGAKQLREAGTR